MHVSPGEHPRKETFTLVIPYIIGVIGIAALVCVWYLACREFAASLPTRAILTAGTSTSASGWGWWAC